jgi:hypothetical protein
MEVMALALAATALAAKDKAALKKLEFAPGMCVLPGPAHELAPAIPNGPLAESQRFKFICCAGVLPTARRQWQQGRASTAKFLLCPEGQKCTLTS